MYLKLLSKIYFTDKIILGAFPLIANVFNRLMASSLPTMSSNVWGRYFSILHISIQLE